MIGRFVIGLAALLVLAAAPVQAHEDYRTVGVVTKRYKDEHNFNWIQVRNGDKLIIPVWVSSSTVIKRDEKTVGVDQLTVGTTVVVDSYGDTLEYSEGRLIRIVPPIPGMAR